MPFQNENLFAGLPINGEFQNGISNVDRNEELERGIDLPWSSHPAGSYVYYDCTVGVMLDNGIVVHNRLPQVNRMPDTLAAVNLNDTNLDTITNAGVSLKSRDQYEDIVQRMGHSRYWFRLWGQALRVGYRVPIPGIKTIGGVPAIPYDRNPQWAYNTIAPGANYGGVILWLAVWSLWYTTAVPPRTDAIPEANPFAHISGTDKPPKTVQAPFTIADDEAQTAEPGIVVGGKPPPRR